MEETYSVYAKIDGSGHITAVNSDAFLADLTGWTKIVEGTGDRFQHAQGNFFSRSITTDGGAYRYKLADGDIVECSSQEIAEQEAANQPSAPESPYVTYYVTWEALEKALKEGVNSV